MQVIFNSPNIPFLICVLTLTLPTCTSCAKKVAPKSCSLQWKTALPSWFPLIWETTSIIYPNKFDDGQWEIRRPTNSLTNISCSNNSNKLSLFNQPIVKLICEKGKFNVGKQAVNFEDLGCNAPLTEHISKKGSCEETQFDKIQIAFHAPETITFPLITVCHDPVKDESVLAHHTIYGSSLNTFEVSNKRPGFKEAGYYAKINANTAYSQKSQQQSIRELLGSESLAAKYIDRSKSFYFARGHLAPDGDFVHIYEQNATYYFVNVVPQWQSINNGNWKALELAIRKYAMQKETTLQIWTGTVGVLELDDVSGNPVEIYLAKDISGQLRLPVPEIMWKVIHDHSSKSAVVVFVINNPHLQEIAKEFILCSDICSSISWVKWKVKSIPKGYTYCCDMKSAKRIIKNVPNLGTVGLLS